jgi:hypothetical protein
MYYLRNYETILFSNGAYTHVPTSLTKADCYGIMKRNHVSLTPTYDNNYITEYQTNAIKHPTQELWCIEFENVNGLNPIYIPFLETKEVLEADGWVIDGVEVESIPYEEITHPVSVEDRIAALEDVMMMLLM